MTIDEAIEHERWAAENSEGERAAEHRQIAEWLRQARGADKAARRYAERIRVLDTENAGLRDLAERAWRAAERLCQAYDGPCINDGSTFYKPCPMGERDEECVYGRIQRDLRELGVEVDG